MEIIDINQSPKKIKKIKIRSYTTFNFFKEELENENSIEEFYFSFKQCFNPNEFLKIIPSLLSNRQYPLRLQIKVQFGIVCDICQFLKQLDKFQNLISLELLLLNEQFLVDEDYITIGDSIINISSLKRLYLKVEGSKLAYNSNFLKIGLAYQKLINLESLKITLLNCNKQRDFISCLFLGLSFSKNLQYLSFKSWFNNYQSKSEIFAFGEELKQLENLKIFKLKDYNFQTNNYSHEIATNIKFLKNLESLTIDIPIDNDIYCYLEGISELQNLKYIKFASVNSKAYQNRYQYFSEISKCTGLETIHLSLNIHNYLNSDNNTLLLNELATNLNQLTTLTSLDISCRYSFQFENNDFMGFFNQMSKFTSLKKLNMLFDEIPALNDSDSINLMKNFKNPFINLEEISINSTVFKSIFFQECPDQFWIIFIEKMNSLKSLNIKLEKEDKTGDSQKIYLNSFSQNSKLESLNLEFDDNYELISRDSAIDGGFLQNLTNMINLQVHYDGQCSNGNDSLVQLSDSLKKMVNLKSLDVKFWKDQKFQFSSLTSLYNSFQHLQNLKKLYLRIKEIFLTEQDETFYLISSIKNLKQLKLLVIKYDVVQDHQKRNTQFHLIDQLPPNLKQINITIKKEGLRFYNIKQLIFGLGELRNLSILTLNIPLENLLEDQCEEIYNSLINIQSLVELNLDLGSFQTLQLSRLLIDLLFLNKIILLKPDNQNYISFCREEDKQKNNNEIKIKFFYDEQIKQKDIKIIENCFKNNNFHSIIMKINENNELDSQLCAQLFTTFTYLTNMTHLQLEIDKNVTIVSDSFNQLGIQMKNLSNLISLIIIMDKKGHTISMNKASDFIEGLLNLVNLRKLQLKLNVFNSKDLNILLASLSNLQLLESLMIRFHNLISFDDNQYMFDSNTFPNLNELKIIAQNILKKSKGNRLFYKSFRNLKNLNSIAVFRKEVELQVLKKMARLVKVRYEN